jgi:hypothetical protein
MAITKKKETSLKIKRRNELIIQLITIMMGLFSIPIFMVTRNIYTTIVVILLCFIIVWRYIRKRKIYDYGIKGEMETAKELSKLNNKYYVYNDIIIGGKEKGAQIDHLVLSPYGIFAIETKNMRGTITGKEEDNNWVQKKVGQGGKVYEKEFYNPCKQSKGHVNAINNMLVHQNFHDIKIYSVVVFDNNSDTKLKIEASHTTVLELDKLLNFMLSKKDTTIDDYKLKALVKVIDKQIS